MYCVETREEARTRALGEDLGRLLVPPMLIGLNGGLGTGKTVFARGVAAGCGVEGPVTSPTFTLLNIYIGRFPVYHFDFYRLEEEEELWELACEEYFFDEGVTLIEWAEKFPAVLPEEYLEVRLERHYSPAGKERRRICFYPHGNVYRPLVEELITRC